MSDLVKGLYKVILEYKNEVSQLESEASWLKNEASWLEKWAWHMNNKIA